MQFPPALPRPPPPPPPSAIPTTLADIPILLDTDSEDERLLSQPPTRPGPPLRRPPLKPLPHPRRAPPVSPPPRPKRPRTRPAHRIRTAFARAAAAGTFKRTEVLLRVSPPLLKDTTLKSDVLARVRLLFPAQILPHHSALPNLIVWRRGPSPAAPAAPSPPSPSRQPPPRGENANPDAPVSLLVFSGRAYWDMMVASKPGDRLFDVADRVKAEQPGHAVMYMIYGIASEVKRRANAIAAHPDAREKIVTLRAVQDSYTALHIKYGIRTHVFAKVNDAAKYLVELTDAFALKPYYVRDDFVDATLRYRDARKKLANRSTFTELEEVGASQEDGFGEHGDGSLGGDDDALFISYERPEGRRDLRYNYLSFLALIPRVSYNTAIAIREQYPTFVHLFRAYRRCSSQEERHSLLADVRFGTNNRRIGPALSKTIATAFTSENGRSAFRS